MFKYVLENSGNDLKTFARLLSDSALKSPALLLTQLLSSLSLSHVVSKQYTQYVLKKQRFFIKAVLKSVLNFL